MNEQFKKSIVEWLNDQVSKFSYGECNIKVVVHAGRIARVERSFTEKLQEA